MLTMTRACTAAAALTVAACIAAGGVAHADPNGQMYGDPTAAAPFWRYQHHQDCGLMAVADVVGQVTGQEPPQAGIQLRGMFTKTRPMRAPSTTSTAPPPRTWSVPLQQFGIESQITTGNTMPTLEQDLATGHKVIASINAETIWNADSGEPRRGRPRRRRPRRRHPHRPRPPQRQRHPHRPRRADPPGQTFTQAWATSNNQLIVT